VRERATGRCRQTSSLFSRVSATPQKSAAGRLFSPSILDAGYYTAPNRRLSRLPRPQVETYFAGLFK
jgi:hypothetical protein